MTDVSHDPDDFPGRAAAAGSGELEPLAESVASGPVPAREGAVDDDDFRRRGGVAVREVATADEGDAQRGEIARRHGPDGGLRNLARILRRLVFDDVALGAVGPGKRQLAGAAGGFDSRQPRRARGELAKERGQSGVVGVAVGGRTTSIVVTPRGSNPGATRRSARGSTSRRLAPTSSTSAAATSVTVTKRRTRDEPPASHRTDRRATRSRARSDFQAASAGHEAEGEARQDGHPRREGQAPARRCRRFPGVRSRSGRARRAASRLDFANRTPARPPAARASSPRAGAAGGARDAEAPIAERIAISVRRPAARASCRLAMLAHATTSTSSTVASRMSRAGRTRPDQVLLRTRRPGRPSPCCPTGTGDASAAVTTSISRCAASMETPSASRPTP